jgi:hypothetical protein
MTATPNRLAEEVTMTDEQIIELAKQITGWTIHFSIPQEPLGHFYDGHRHQASVERIVHFARALLSASRPVVPQGFAIKRVEGHGWIIDPPSGSRWVAYEGTPAGELIQALAASSAAPSVDQDERRAFEAWARKQPKHIVKDLQRYDDNYPDASRAGQYGHCTTATAWQIWQDACAASISPNVAQGAEHPDDVAVDRFAAAMKDKLAAARAKGRSGWQQCSPFVLSEMLRAHVDKGDPRDVANFCMMLWNLDWSIAAPPAQTAQPSVVLDDERAIYHAPRFGTREYWDAHIHEQKLAREAAAQLDRCYAPSCGQWGGTDECTCAALQKSASQPDQPTPSCMDGGEDAVEMARKDGLLDAPADDARDAVRYRTFFDSGLPICFCGVDYYSKADLDAAIDAARTAGEPK